MLSLRRELRVLGRPATAVVAFSAVAMVFLVVALQQAKAAGQWAIYLESGRLAGVQLQECRAGEEPTSVCAEIARENRVEQQRFAADLRDRYVVSSAATDPIGAAGVAAGLMASLPGLLAVSALAAVHVAGEWALGTVRPLLARSSVRMRLYGAKIFSTWLTALGLLALCWLALVAAAPLIQALYAVPPPPPGFDSGAYAWPMLAKAPLVLAAVAVVGVAAATWLRNVMGTFVLLLAGLFASVVLAGFRPLVEVTPAYWLTSWMGFQPSGSAADHVWVNQFPLLDPDPPCSRTRLWA